MKKKNLLRKGLALVLTIVMAVGYLPLVPDNPATVQAADGTTTATTTGKTIAGLGTGIIAEPTVPTASTSAWEGSYVYYGTYGDNPVKYRVLDKDSTDFGGTTMLLDCDTVLWAGSDPSSVFDADSSVWADSDIKSYLNDTFLTTSFSLLEQNAIAGSSKAVVGSTDGNGWSDLGWTSLNGEKIFFLDAKEATNTSYGYFDTDSNATGRIKTGGNACWWLRSPGTFDRGVAGYVYEGGDIYYGYVGSRNVGVSPALNVNLSSVLFSSVISGTAGETGAEYKLTLLDSDMTIAKNGEVIRSGSTVTIPYAISGTNGGNATQASILILDRTYSDATKNEAVVKYYGALDTSAGNGTGTFTLPADLSDKVCGRDYYAYIIAEEVNGEKETDYASTPASIAIPWEAPTVDKMNLGTSGIINPAVPTATTDAWTGCYVYYGTYGGNPVKYRVLDKNSTDFGGTTMLLDCDTVLWAGSDPSSVFDADSNAWAYSDIKSYLNSTFLTTSFSTTEQNAIAESTKMSEGSTDGNGQNDLAWTSLSGEKIFFLDAKEATNTSYGYFDTDSNAAGRIKTGGNACWWLRSPDASSTNFAGYVHENGLIYYTSFSSTYFGVSPALNLNLSSVIFSSASGTSKSSVLTSSSNEIGSTTGTEWKLTLSDSGKSVKVTDNEKVIKSADGTITVPYTYTDTATVEAEKVNQISVMITDKAYTESDANILYYGALQNIKDADDNDSTVAAAATGTGTFELPSALSGKVMGTDYHVYILAEHTTDTNATDYASTPKEIISGVEIGIEEPVAEQKFELTPECGVGVNASVTWMDENDTEVNGTIDYNTKYKATFTLTTDTGFAFTEPVNVTVNGNPADAANVTLNGGTLTVTYEFEPTEKRKITNVTAPKVPDTFTEYYLEEPVLKSTELSSSATIGFNGSLAPATKDMEVEWSIANSDGSGYNATPGETNTFKWKVKETEYADDYELAEGAVMEGTVTIINKAYTPVTITTEDATITYAGKTIDVSKYFKIDTNAGTQTYKVVSDTSSSNASATSTSSSNIGGTSTTGLVAKLSTTGDVTTGEGTLDGTMLTVTKTGKFVIKVNTDVNGIYGAGEATVILTVEKGEYPVNRPESSISASNSCETVSEVTLPDNWVWADDNKDDSLTVGEEVTATAQYTGADKECYKTVEVEISITRSACEHTEGKVVHDGAVATDKAPNCTETGLGHTVCTKAECGDVVRTGITISALGHSYESKVTKPATYSQTGIRTYTCTREGCTDSYEKIIPKKSSSSSSSSTTTPPTTEEPSTEEPTTEEPTTEDPSTGDSSTEAPSTEDSTTETPSTSEDSNIDWKTDEKGTFYETEDGTRATGWKELKEDVWYYFDEEGYRQTGWVKDNKNWYYLNENGVMQTHWEKVDGNWYYLNESGAMQTDWVKVNGDWYYLNVNGIMKTGWHKDGETWYYLNVNGAMKTGWLKDGETWYYLNINGAMKTGWHKDGNTWYYLSESGAMKTGWLKDGNTWYYLSENGSMKTGWLKDGETWYYLNESGAMQTGWLKLGTDWFYLNANGSMAADTYIGRWYVDKDGYYIPSRTK